MESLNREKVPSFISALYGTIDKQKKTQILTDDDYYKQVEKALISSFEEKLTPREKKIALMRYGLEDGRSRSVEQVGQAFGITKERMRCYEAKIFRKLRHPLVKDKIKVK